MNKSTLQGRTPRVILPSLLLGLLAVSFSAIFIEWSSAPSSVIGMYRLWISVVVLLPMAWTRRREILSIRLSQLIWISLAGIFLGLHFLLWIQSLKETSVASSMIILSLEPLFVFIGSIMVFKAKLTKPAVLSMVFAILGCVFVASGDLGRGQHHVWGDLLSLFGTLAVSVYMIAGQKVRETLSSTSYNTVVFFIAGLILFLFNLLTHQPFLAYSGENWLMFALLALVSTLLGHGIFNWLLDRVSAATVSMTILGEPIGAIVLAYFLLGQPVHWLQGVGGVICLTSVYVFLKSDSLQYSNDKQYPSGEEADAANRSDGTKGSYTCRAQEIQAAGE